MAFDLTLGSITASLPSPSQGVWYLGPVPVRAYALFIICGILVAWKWMEKRYCKRGGNAQDAADITFLAVILGIVGARIYHVITDYQLYFSPGSEPIRALYIWQGGLGIWGAVIGGGVGAWIVTHRKGLPLGSLADSLAPALLVAQAIGRLGNYFNQELFGAPTNMPWGLEIDAAHMPDGYGPGTLFHPTFLYEMLWCLAGALLLTYLERIRTFAPGQLFCVYVMYYTLGRVWIEMLRIDSAHHVLGLRLNVWTSVIVFCGGLIVYYLLGRRARTKNGECSHEDKHTEEIVSSQH